MYRVDTVFPEALTTSNASEIQEEAVQLYIIFFISS